MWPFRRKKADNNVPEEVKEYYQAEQRERMGLAWILAVVTLAATVLVVLGLFFGGRWAYRKLANNDQVPTAAVQKPAKPTETAAKPGANTSTNNASSSTNQSSSQPATSNVTTSSQTPSNTNMPNTGPAGTLAAFITVSILGFCLNELRLRRRLLKD